MHPKKHEFSLKRCHSSDFYEMYKNQPHKPQLVFEYYYRATHFLFAFGFDSDCDRQIWEMHSDGIGVRDISRIISKKFKKLNKDEIAAVIKKLKEEMRFHQLWEGRLKE
jgi:hypothetical protein